MGLMKMMLMPFKMMKHMHKMWRPMMMALGLMKMMLMPLKMMKHMHKMGHMHKMWRSMVMMMMLAQLAMLMFIAVVIIASTVLPVLLFFAFLMKKWMKKNMCLGTHCKNMMHRRFKP